ncbi:MAG: putative sugar O-methyltransferase [Candidatus Omnitrophota bacterium]|nr:putative sugar O-methyltransferase [Candidatus Omnitrophota bacterium]
MNINYLPRPDIVRALYNSYYLQRDTEEITASSHWKEFGQKVKVCIDNNGNLTSYKGYGFGDLQPTNALNRTLKYFCNLTYFIKLQHKKEILTLIEESRVIIKKINSYLSYDCFRQICSLSVIRQYLKIDHHEEFNILVIGDGFGFLSALLKKIYPNCKITLLDLGKVLLFQAINLQRIYPKQTHFLITNSFDAGEVDFLYVPADKSMNMKNLKYRLLINIASMQEMDYKTINDYFALMRRNSAKDNLFYCCNRKQKILPGGEVINFSRYPWVNTDRYLVDEVCPFYKYHFSAVFPFIHKFDGVFIHRLANLELNT